MVGGIGGEGEGSREEGGWISDRKEAKKKTNKKMFREAPLKKPVFGCHVGNWAPFCGCRSGGQNS